MRFKGFIGPTYQLKSVNVDAQRCTNMYPVLNEMGVGKEGEIAFLKSTPGLEKILDINSGPIRCIHVDAKNRVFIVSGNTVRLATFDGTTWTAGTLGTLATTTGIVTAASNTIGLYGSGVTVFVDGDNSYMAVDSIVPGVLYFGNFASFAFPPILESSHVVFIDGYFIFNQVGTNQFVVSGLNDVAVDPLSFASAEADPDNIVAIIALRRDLWLFNERTTEIFVNSGGADFPFDRAGGGFIEKGCTAKFSVAKIEGCVFWLGRDEFGQGVVYLAQGFNPQRISTHAIEYAIQSYANMSAATGYTYQSEGNVFYVLNFAEATWVYDLTSKLWHERAYTNAGVLERHRGDVCAFIPQYGIHMVGDYANSKVYRLDENVFTDDTAAITRMRASPHLSNGLKKMFCSSFQLDMETGVGLNTGLGSDPQVILDFSDNGGHTWSSESWATAGGQVGGIGDFKKRVIWRRLGSFRDRVFRVKITDPVKVTMIGAELALEPGVS